MRSLIVTATVCTLLIGLSEGILNGVRSPHKPYYARISYRNLEGNQQTVHFKSGVIISDRFVLTTNEFFGRSMDYQVYVGSNVRNDQVRHAGGGMIRLTSGLSSIVHGLALIQLIEPLEFSLTVQSIRLIPSDAIMGLDNEQGMVLGFGMAGAARENLQAGFMRMGTNCSIFIQEQPADEYFCAIDTVGLSDFCGEDRGTSMTVLSRGQEYLVGIAVTSVCNSAPHGRPSVFVRMSFYVDFLNQIVRSLGS